MYPDWHKRPSKVPMRVVGEGHLVTLNGADAGEVPSTFQR
jgi:hypothetical protein